MQVQINTEISSAASASSRTQRGRILGLLIAARGEWVGLPEIAALAAQYNARVLELRRLGFVIENRTEKCDGVRRSSFRLVVTSALVASSSRPSAADSDAGKSQAITPSNQKSLSSDPRHESTLPLFPEGHRDQ